ncbi:hypothetical protein PROFUN_05942 [Planoprotostelium fungivorum]|uniref:Acyl-coenzyme A oxidase n=1 Tax=Planoprotostelium fungivorum TaxID=1890364 RepID=A0A2P6N7N5_9EUKA|nr:hypothetical protein PROFUN_05942 [Planoprotostelium fungivorum]
MSKGIHVSATNAQIESMKDERKNPSFDSRSLTFLLYGGEKAVRTREEIRDELERRLGETDNNKIPHTYVRGDRTEQYHSGLETGRIVQSVAQDMQIFDFEDERQALLFAAYHREASPYGLHTSMFIPTLKTQASEEQQKEWLGKAQRREILGTYAQTELGHGTFVRGLETTATYDVERKEFVLHSPTITSTKWWPGGLGYTSTHAVVMARLIVKDKDYGVHGFITPLRSLDDHRPLPGVILGDIGPKFGYNANDNGFLRLDQVRIPLKNMLARFSRLHEDGTYEKPPHAKLSYGTMVFVRSNMILNGASALAKASTIAIRYSCVREQGMVQPKQAGETKLMNYKSQQYRLLPLLSHAFAIHFTGFYILDMYKDLLRRLDGSDFSTLPVIHATTSGLKAYVTTVAADGIEEARKCCGGHGYSQFSGLPTLFADYVPSCTFEGDNWVLFQQTARFLIKSLKAAVAGKPLAASVAYLKGYRAVGEGQKSQAKSGQDLLIPQVQLKAFEHRATRLIMEAAQLLETDRKAGKQYEISWNAHMIDLIRAARAHTLVVILTAFIERVEATTDEKNKRVLKKLCDLFCLYNIESPFAPCSSEFVEDSYFSPAQIRMARDNVHHLLSELRPDAVPLVDAWNFSDAALESALGRRDGNVYETLYNWASQTPLNQKAAKEGGVDVEGYTKHVKKVLEGGVNTEPMRIVLPAKFQFLCQSLTFFRCIQNFQTEDISSYAGQEWDSGTTTGEPSDHKPTYEIPSASKLLWIWLTLREGATVPDRHLSCDLLVQLEAILHEYPHRDIVTGINAGTCPAKDAVNHLPSCRVMSDHKDLLCSPNGPRLGAKLGFFRQKSTKERGLSRASNARENSETERLKISAFSLGPLVPSVDTKQILTKEGVSITVLPFVSVVGLSQSIQEMNRANHCTFEGGSISVGLTFRYWLIWFNIFPIFIQYQCSLAYHRSFDCFKKLFQCFVISYSMLSPRAKIRKNRDFLGLSELSPVLDVLLAADPAAEPTQRTVLTHQDLLDRRTTPTGLSRSFIWLSLKMSLFRWRARFSIGSMSLFLRHLSQACLL